MENEAYEARLFGELDLAAIREPRPPAPGDAAARIKGLAVPKVMLSNVADGDFDLAAHARSRRRLVVCLYPGIGTRFAEDRDQRRAVEWERRLDALRAQACGLIFISTDRLSEQQQWLLGPMPPRCLVLHDRWLALAAALNLATTHRYGRHVYAPATLVIGHGRILDLFADGQASVEQIYAALDSTYV